MFKIISQYYNILCTFEYNNYYTAQHSIGTSYIWLYTVISGEWPNIIMLCSIVEQCRDLSAAPGNEAEWMNVLRGEGAGENKNMNLFHLPSPPPMPFPRLDGYSTALAPRLTKIIYHTYIHTYTQMAVIIL